MMNAFDGDGRGRCHCGAYSVCWVTSRVIEKLHLSCRECADNEYEMCLATYGKDASAKAVGARAAAKDALKGKPTEAQPPASD